jgi:hypothetical protein
MPRKKHEEAATLTVIGRLPNLNAESSLGPATRPYRSPQSTMSERGFAVLPSQWEDESETEETSDDPAEVIMDESDDLGGDPGEDDVDGNSSDDDE